MRRIRDALTLLILLACLAICGAATVEIARQSADRPAVDGEESSAVRDVQAELLGELRRVMVDGRLDELPKEDQQRFVRRMDEQFTAPSDWEQLLGELNEQEQARFEDNLETLAQLWLASKVDRYFSLPASEQMAFLDAEIQRGLDVVDQAQTYDEQQPGTAGDRFRGFGRYFQRIRNAFENSPPAQRQRTALFLFALQSRWNNKWRDAAPTRQDD